MAVKFCKKQEFADGEEGFDGTAYCDYNWKDFGSKGREIGEKLAARRGFSFYDKNLILMAAQKTGMDVELLDSADEKIISRLLDPYASGFSIQGSTNDRLYSTQADLIREFSGREDCVIVGRMADYILRDNPDCIRVFVYAPFATRVATIQEKYHLTEGQAKKLVKQMDKIRRNYYQYFTDEEWDDKNNKNILLDSSMLGVDGSVELLDKLVEMKLAAMGRH